MKRILSIGFFLCAVMCSIMAQSQYISNQRHEAGDRAADLNGAGGVLLLSSRSDLAITVINAKNPTISPRGEGASGLYEYEVVVDVKETRNPKLEINRRGDVNRTSITASIRPDFFRAYKIEEVPKPIHLEDQTAPNDAILDSTLAEVVISSTIPDLEVEWRALQEKGAEMKTSNSQGDKSIINKSILIPVRIFREAQQKLNAVGSALAEKRKVLDDPKASKKLKDDFWTELEDLENQEAAAMEEYSKLGNIAVHADGSNVLSIYVADLKPRTKKVYGVAVVKVIEEKHVSECSGMLAEGARQYSLREYDNAQKAFANALKAKDTPADLVPTIRTNMAQCDSCKLYERYAMAALAELQKVRNGGGTQEQVVQYASAAIEFMDKLNMYNPCSFYSERIERLNKVIEDQPLSIKFTFVEWINNYSGFYEGDALPDVEVWVCEGVTPDVNEFRNDKRFNKLVASGGYRRVGISDVRGELDLTFDRKSLPTGLIFRPVGTYEQGRIKTEYTDIREVMQKSEGDYQKRQFRTKLYKDSVKK